MHQSENTKIKLITIINKDEYSWLILLYARVEQGISEPVLQQGISEPVLQQGKPIVEPRRAKPKTYRQAPTHWLKFYEEAVIGSEARTAVMQLKSEA